MGSKQSVKILEFSSIFAVFFLILSLVTGKTIFSYSAFITLILGLFFKPLLAPLYALWIRLSVVLGTLNGLVIMSLIFYLVLTPLAMIRRLKQSDPLLLKKNQGDSYWIPVEKSYAAKYFEQQF